MKNLKNKITFLFLLAIVIFVKCKKESISPLANNTNTNSTSKVNYLFNPLSRDTKLFENYYNGKGNYRIGYDCQKGYGLLENITRELYTSAYANVTFDNSKTLNKVKSCSIDDILLKERTTDGNYSYSLDRTDVNNVIHSWYGKNVKFKMNYDGTSSRTTDLEVTSTCYIPLELNIDGNSIKNTFGITTILNDGENGVSRNGNYTINWNADANNKNGVAIIVSWMGKSYSETSPHNPTDTPNFVTNLDIVDDNGTYIIKAENFKDMPKNAIFSTKLIRIGGTNDTVGSGQKLFVGATMFSLPSFYIKD